MSFDVMTLALAKSYTDQHGGGGGGASTAGDFVIKMTIEVNGDNYTVTSCDKTMEQIDAAVASGQNIKAIASDKYVIPMIQMEHEYSESYTFGAFLGSFLVVANVTKNHESGADDWEFYLSPIIADMVEYSNASMPRISTVEDALNKLIRESHTHANKDALDKLSISNGKLQYNGSDILIKSDKQEIVNDVLAALPTWTGGNY